MRCSFCEHGGVGTKIKMVMIEYEIERFSSDLSRKFPRDGIQGSVIVRQRHLLLYPEK